MELTQSEINSLLVTNSTDILALMQVDGKMIYESPVVDEVYGYESGELLNKNVLALIHPADLPGILRLMAESILQPGKKYQFRYRFKAKNGEYLLMESTAMYVVTEKFKGYIVESRRSIDTDEINTKLAQAEEKYRRLFENLPDGYALHEVVLGSDNNPINYRFLEVNASFLKMFGFERNDVVGKLATDVFPGIEKDSFGWIGKYGKLAMEGGMFEFSQYSEALKKYFKGKAVGLSNNQFLVTFADITDEKNRDADLVKLKIAIDNASDHIVITDENGIVLYANPAVEKITGYSLSEVLGSKAGKLWALPMPTKIYEQMWKTIKTDLQTYKGEITNRRKNGDLYQARVNISPIIDTGILKGFVGIEEDISDLKRSESELITKIEEMEKLNNLMVGREIKMTELKEANAKLIERLKKYEP